MSEPGVRADAAVTTTAQSPAATADHAQEGLLSSASMDTVRSLQDAAASAVGAFGAVPALADVAGLKVVATVGFDPADVDSWRDIGVGARVPLVQCLRRNRRVGVDSREVASARHPESASTSWISR